MVEVIREVIWDQMVVVGRMWTINLIYLINIGLINELFLLKWVLVVCVFQGVCPFHVSHEMNWDSIVPNFIILLISARYIVISPLSFLISIPSFFFLSMSRSLSTLLIFSGNLFFISLIFPGIFLFSITLISFLLFPFFCVDWV